MFFKTAVLSSEQHILQEDFHALTKTIVCKVCCDKVVAAVFLPCGHLVCCLDRATAMRRCPLFAELIKGTVKTYFA
ncbi:putative inhibitor of apoptosis [Saccostrea echinata]|uniref:putative inhibitor of apoptosis n=1 Tax=Saccostrea echinata TaxID=191078 RepID=UPI002A7F8996|nr:putative inhibitor of apoptosis [Saccostrea echinata]